MSFLLLILGRAGGWIANPKNWPLIGVLALCAVILMQHVALGAQGQRIDALTRSVAQANQAAADAKAQAQLNSKVTEAIDRAATKEAAITLKTQGAVDAVQHAQGASDALPPAVVSAWSAGIDGMRSLPDAEPASGGGAAQPSQPVQPSGSPDRADVG